MKAVGYRQPLPISETDSLIDVEIPDPEPSGRDLLVQVNAISVNPVDTHVRKRSFPQAGQEVKVLGWDAAGTVLKTGPEARLFKPGEAVWYAGSINRPGSNAEMQLVDERIVGRKPVSLGFAEAAAMPLTTITAWELLFERFGVMPGKDPTEAALLVIGAAGGVGSILTQLARRLTNMTVIGTASRKESADWVTAHGAHYVIDHSRPLTDELIRIGIPQVSHVASLTQTPLHYHEVVELLLPYGKFALIDDFGQSDISLLRRKSISFYWEYMFTRPEFATPDMAAQHDLLCEVADLVDDGVIHDTLGEHFGRINAQNLKRAHALIESGKTIGKIVLEGW